MNPVKSVEKKLDRCVRLLEELNMQVRVDVAVLVLGKVDDFTISSQVVVAETIIVGQVPDMFLQTGGMYELQRENR